MTYVRMVQAIQTAQHTKLLRTLIDIMITTIKKRGKRRMKKQSVNESQDVGEPIKDNTLKQESPCGLIHQDIENAARNDCAEAFDNLRIACDQSNPVMDTIKKSGRHPFGVTPAEIRHREQLTTQAEAMDRGEQIATARGISHEVLIEEIARRLHEAESTLSSIRTVVAGR